MSIKLEKLPEVLTDIIEKFTDEKKELVELKLDNTADDILVYITNNCPKSKGKIHLADSFIKTEIGTWASKTIYISSKTKGRLVHLIELGFRHRSGKQIPAKPFLRPAYDTFTPHMLDEIRKIIGGN